MSTILKALRRLEDQKAGAAPKPLRDEVVLAPARGGTGRGRAVAWGAGLAFALAGALLLVWLRTEPVVEAVAPTQPDVAAPAPTDADTLTTIVVAPEPPPAEPETAAVAPALDDDDFGAVAAPDFDIVRPDPTATARPLAPPPLPKLSDEPPATAPAPARSTPKRVVPVYEEEPLEEPVVAPVARAASSVRVARTQWHPSPDRRLAWVEVEGKTALREVREGERVGPYLVREIEPAAVLFSDGPVEIRREVGR